MAAPASDQAISFGELVEVTATEFVEMGEEFGPELLSRVAISARRRDAEDFTEGGETFVKGVLQREFVSAEDQHGDSCEGQSSLARKVLRPLPEPLECRRTVQFLLQVFNQLPFVFLFILMVLDDCLPYFNAIAP